MSDTTFVSEVTKAKPKRVDRRRARRDWPHGRLSVLDGTVSVMTVDRKNPWVRRCVELMRAHMGDLGGEENASVAMQSVIRRVSALEVELENMEGRFAVAGCAEERDLQLYSVVAHKVHAMLKDLGMTRVARDVTPSLAEVLSRDAIDAKRADSDPENDC